MKKTLLLLAAAFIAFAAIGCKKGDDAPSATAAATGSKIKDKTPSAGDE